ncbi:glycosyltransferase [Marinobacter sp.]|uniref:glycosyltransferase n=1 Tax=Marinobacter sp. TaxID=50741 RepID=UPI0034A260DC
MSKKKAKLLVLTSTYPRWLGDYEPGFVHELSKRLTQEFEVTVLCPRSKGASSLEFIDDVRIIRFRYAPSPFESLIHNGGIIGNIKANPLKATLLPLLILGQFFAFLKIIIAWKPDVIHAHWLIPQGLMAAMFSVLGCKVPFLVTSHGADLYSLRSSIFQKLKRFVARRANACTVVSRAMLEEARRIDIACQEITVEPMGVDLSGRFVNDPAVARSNNEILFVGRLVEKKGLKYLLDAMPGILSNHPAAKLIVVGFGPEEANLKDQASNLSLDNSVEFVGAVEQHELPQYYQRACVFVAPFVRAEGGDQEGLGLVLVEALGCGCKVVVSKLPAVEDVIEHTSSVTVVPPGDPRAITSAVSQMLKPVECSGDRTSEWQSSEQLKLCFDWNHVATRYATKLKRISQR